MSSPAAQPPAPTTFVQGLFARPLATLSALLASDDDAGLLNPSQAAKDVYAELDRCRPWLLRGLKAPGPSAEERKSVESGSLKVGSKTIPLSAAFIADALALSATLNISELLAASLHRSALASTAKFSRPARETAVLLWEAERLELVELLKLLCDERAWRDRAGEPAAIVRSFGQELRGSLVGLEAGKEGSLVERLLADLELLKATALDLRKQLAAAASAANAAAPTPASHPSAFNTFAPAPPPAALPAASGSGGDAGKPLSPDIIKERLTAIRTQRQGLGHVLFLLGQAGWLRKKELQQAVRWLARQAAPEAAKGAAVAAPAAPTPAAFGAPAAVSGSDAEADLEEESALLGYFISTLLAAFEMSELKSEDVDHERIIQEKFLKDTQYIKIMTAEIVEKPWKHKPLQSLITLQWTLYLVTAFRYNDNLSATIAMSEEFVEGLVQNAIRSDALQFARDHIVLAADRVDDAFKWHMLSAVDLLVTSFVTTMSPILRKLKHREEDALLNPPSSGGGSKSLSASGRRSLGGAVPASSTSTATPVRADIEALFSLIAALYDDCPPDAALKFWTDRPDGRLFAFLRWAADSRGPGMIRALSDMLASLAAGQQCATFAFGFLASGSEGGEQGGAGATVCSWSALFEALQFYAQQLPKINERSQAAESAGVPGLPGSHQGQAPRRDANAPSTIPPDELALLTAFLRLLKNVVRYSPVARAALFESAQFRALPTLLALINSVVPVSFKAALFDTLAAFCGTEGGPLGAEIARQMWYALERFELVPAGVKAAPFGGLYRSTAGRGGSGAGGIIAEFEDAEVEAGSYPATAAFVNLLDTLIHTPARPATLLGGFESPVAQTIPENLGAGARAPGMAPYVRYVMHDVLLRAPKLAYVDERERWTLIERSLCFIEKCLATYDLSPVLLDDVASGAGARSSHSKAGVALLALAAHPGFEILRKLLTEPALLKALFDVVSVSLDGLLDDGGRTPTKADAVLRALRIVHRILAIQGLFVEVLLPTLAESAGALGLNPSSIPTAVAPLDQHLLYTHAVVIDIALLVNFAERQEIALLAVQIVGQLSQSPFFRAVDRFENVYSSHMNRLVGVIDSSDESLRILDGFVRRLESEGAGEPGWTAVDDPVQALVTAETGRGPSAVEEDLTETIRVAVLDLLLANTTAGTAGPNIAHFLCGFPLNASPADLSIDDPQAEGANLSCLHIILELLAQGTHAPGGEQAEYIEPTLLARNPALAEKCARLIYQLSTHELTGPATARYLRTREEFSARQLAAFPMTVPAAPPAVALGQVVYPDGGSVSTSAGALTSFLRYRSSILDAVALELHTVNPTGLHAAKLVDSLFTIPKEANASDSNRMDTAEQRLIRVLDILLSMDFQWQDDIPDMDIKLAYFANFDFNACLIPNEAGCEVYDFRALVGSMDAVRRRHQATGALAGPGQQEALQSEIRGILLTLAAENHQREVAHARQACLVSWQRVLDVVLFKSFELIPADEREAALFDLIQAAFHLVALPEWPPAAAELLCQAVLSLITRLRQGREEAAIAGGEAGKPGPALPTDKLHNLLKQVLEGIARSGTTQVVRGNLYTVLINYLQIVSPQGSAAAAVEPGSLTILLSTMDRVVPIICRDALDGSEIWKTVAYAALETLLAASASDRSHRLVGILYRNGYLQSFVQSLKDTENDLRAVMAPDPESLNAFYVYEAKTALLLRIAESRAGAERLLDARLLDVLTQCYFIEDRPELDQAMLDVDSFLPPVFERYHQILLPVLQLVSVVASSLGPTSNGAVVEALSFLNAHRETILGLLRDPVGRIPLSTVKELHLLASIFTQVLPTVEQQDLGLSSGFGAYHNALLSLASRFFLREKWEDLIVPLNDAERADTERPAPNGKQNGSLFDFNTDIAVEDLNASLLSYFVLATETRGAAPLRPVFTPSVSTRETGLLQKGGGPSILSAVVLLYETVTYLRSTVDHFAAVSDKLAQPKLLTADEIEEAVLANDGGAAGPEGALPARLSPVESQRLALRSLRKTQRSLKRRSESSLIIIETLLLLLWRHLLFFISEALQDGPAANWATIPPQSVSLRFSQVDGRDRTASGGGLGSLRELWERVSEELHPALGKLERMDLPIDIFGSDTELKTSYLHVMSRRLRELEHAVPDEQ